MASNQSLPKARMNRSGGDLVRDIFRQGVKDERVLGALAQVDRKHFIPLEFGDLAYEDQPIIIGHDQVTTQPSLLARMVQALGLAGKEKVLEIGTGCGFQTAILSKLAKEVVSIERFGDLAATAESNFKETGVQNVKIIVGDGTQGYLEGAPYDAIMVSAASPCVPAPLIDQLQEQGRLVQPIGPSGNEVVWMFQKEGGKLVEKENLGFAHFVPLVEASSSEKITRLALYRPSERASIKKISDTLWEIPTSYKEGMLVPARIFATERLLSAMETTVFEQLTNVATLPGIMKFAYCMPDGHSGYGFPIGGVAAMDAPTGVISPGGIGFDINCGMRLVVTNLTFDEVNPHLEDLVDRLYERVPAGVGSAGFVRLAPDEFRHAVENGSRWCLKNGYAQREDLEFTEDGGCAEGADSSTISPAAIGRGLKQIGTLGSGNHYLELQVARPENVFDEKIAHAFGITQPNQVVVMFHCGSRGFGHQVASDYLKIFLGVMEKKYGIAIRDRELACTPFQSPEGQAYFAAMKCAINMSFVNRQVIFHRIREVFSDVFHKSPNDLGLRQVYDVAHNTAKLERHEIDGQWRDVLVHRKGSTRAFAPQMQGVPKAYLQYGQPVIIGGSMETGSYLLVGADSGAEAFFSTAHGAGRTMSRTKAKKQYRGKQLAQEMKARGIYVRSVSYAGLAEEAGGAYKDVDEVIRATAAAGLSRPIVKFLPIGNVKG